MFKDIFKRLSIQILIYLIIFYLIPFLSTFFNETIEIFVSALFVVILNILVCIVIASFDTYTYKVNYYIWIIPGIIFLPTMFVFNYTNAYIYSILYSLSYGVGMLLGWSYKTYGYQLKRRKD